MVEDRASHGARERLILCAEIVRDGVSIVANTVELGEETAFVQTDEQAFVGDRVQVRLSFPGLVDSFELEAHVISQKVSTEAGDPGGWWLGWVFRDERERRALRELVEAPGSVPEEFAAREAYRVLLVEDSRLTRDVFAHGVERFFRNRKATLTVDVAMNCDEAWRMLSDHDYDLLIVDFYLPGGNGDALIARLRRDERTGSTPVVAISCGGMEARVASLQAGADFFLEKPIVLQDLYQTLDRLVRFREAS